VAFSAASSFWVSRISTPISSTLLGMAAEGEHSPRWAVFTLGLCGYAQLDALSDHQSEGDTDIENPEEEAFCPWTALKTDHEGSTEDFTPFAPHIFGHFSRSFRICRPKPGKKAHVPPTKCESARQTPAPGGWTIYARRGKMTNQS
jgi:hypothetical protein